MTHFFTPYTISIKDWNKLSEEDPVWDKCISLLEQHYTRPELQSSNLDQYIDTTAQDWIRQIKLVKQSVKQFFIEHVITTQKQLLDNAQLFASNVNMNHYLRYTCLIPLNRTCIVDQEIVLGNVSLDATPKT